MSARDERWSERQAAIRDILSRRPVRTQGQLLAVLRARGFEVTQPSVSRDLADLRAVKADGRYRLPDGLVPERLVAEDLAEAARSIREVASAGPHLLVLRTPPGRAALVGLALDRARPPGMAGCIAGDDTVFVAMEGRQPLSVLRTMLGRLAREGTRA